MLPWHTAQVWGMPVLLEADRPCGEQECRL